MVVAISYKDLTVNDIEKNHTIKTTYENCVKHIAKEFTDQMILDFISGIITEAISRAESELIQINSCRLVKWTFY
jgi:hypothetical protein